MFNKIKELLTTDNTKEENRLLKESLDYANAANENYKETINDLTEQLVKDGAEIEKLKEELDNYKNLLDSEVKAYNDLLSDINNISRQFMSKMFHYLQDTEIMTYCNIEKNNTKNKLEWIPKNT